MSGSVVAIERAYPDRDNEIALQVIADGVPIDGAAVTRTVLRLTPEGDGDVIDVDSQDHAAVFDWSRGSGVVEIKLVEAGSGFIAAGRYQARLIIYDADHMNGLIWGRLFSLFYG